MFFDLENKPFDIEKFASAIPTDYVKTLLCNYSRQSNYFSCATASLAIVLNTIKFDKKFKITDKELISSAPVKKWSTRFTEKGDNGVWGITLDELAEMTKSIFKYFNFENLIISTCKIKNDNKSKNKIITTLNTLNDEFFLIANFISNFGIGHFSPIAGYNKEHDSILVLDTFHSEPYWVTMNAFMQGLASKDGNSYRGFLTISHKQ